MRLLSETLNPMVDTFVPDDLIERVRHASIASYVNTACFVEPAASCFQEAATWCTLLKRPSEAHGTEAIGVCPACE